MLEQGTESCLSIIFLFIFSKLYSGQDCSEYKASYPGTLSGFDARLSY